MAVNIICALLAFVYLPVTQPYFWFYAVPSWLCACDDFVTKTDSIDD